MLLSALPPATSSAVAHTPSCVHAPAPSQAALCTLLCRAQHETVAHGFSNHTLRNACCSGTFSPGARAAATARRARARLFMARSSEAHAPLHHASIMCCSRRMSADDAAAISCSVPSPVSGSFETNLDGDGGSCKSVWQSATLPPLRPTTTVISSADSAVDVIVVVSAAWNLLSSSRVAGRVVPTMLSFS